MMRRALVIIALCLLAGAALNYAVGWPCVLWPHRHSLPAWPRRRPVNQAELDWWRHAAPPGIAEPYESLPESGFGWQITSLTSHGPRMTISGQTMEMVSDSSNIALGWPVRSLYGEWFSSVDPANGVWRPTSRWAIRAKLLDQSCPDRLPYLPLRPLWPGFAVNTAIYAAALWVLATTPAALRRAVRRRRGRCPACGYPIGTSDVCTECGARVKP